MLRAAGIVALVVLAACGGSAPKGVASPSPVIAQGNWTQSLMFAGDLSGQMTGIVADTGDQKSQCSGIKVHNGQAWSDLFYGSVDTSGQVWGVVFYIDNFRGPGAYADTSAVIEVHNPDTTMVWASRPGNKVTFTIDRSLQSGTIEATLTSAATGQPTLTVSGHWNCKG